VTGGANLATFRRRLVDLTPLRHSPAFARLWFGGVISGIGTQLGVVAVGLQVYDITESTFAVSLVGGLALLPMVIAGLWGGMIADAFDRKRVLLVSALVGWFATLGLMFLAWYDAGLVGDIEIWPLYLLSILSSIAGTVQGATRSTVTPRLLPDHLVPAASALNGIGFGVQLTVGPAIAGVLVATTGYGWTYAVEAVLFSAAFVGIITLPPIPPAHDVERPGWRSLKQGLAFLRGATVTRAAFVADIIAMTFGRPHVLFPAVGATVIGGGATTVGILTAAMAAGTFLASLFSGPIKHVHRHGVAVARAITVYGAFVLLFGLVTLGMQLALERDWVSAIAPDFSAVNPVALVIASVALVGMGASDEVSAIFRSTMLLMAVPDEVRGRMQGIFTVVVTGGPRLGDLYIGVLATGISLWAPPVFGGVAIIVLIAILLRTQRPFREYDSRNPTP
jgi:MFS family permease